MRRADLIMAVLLALFALYAMWMSARLPIGWVPERGPGGGAFSYWTSGVLLVLSAFVFVRSWRGGSPEGRSREPFTVPRAWRMVGIVTASLFSLLLAVHFIGMYFAIPLFLMFYLRYLGRQSWRRTLSISLITPVITFIFFEKLMLIFLPKGYTERLFYIFY